MKRHPILSDCVSAPDRISSRPLTFPLSPGLRRAEAATAAQAGERVGVRANREPLSSCTTSEHRLDEGGPGSISRIVVLLLCLIALALAGCQKGLDKTTQIPGHGIAGIGDGVGHPSPGPLGTAPFGRARSAPALPGSRPSRHEELWIIAASRSISNPDPRPTQEPNSGALCAKVDDELVPMPLKHTDVQADIAGYIASVQLTQQFQNPHTNKIEAIYVFPLPENAAVNEFIMTIGERRIRGIIRERVEAEQIYQEAKRQGYVASLLTQERPNIFTQSVANLEPGQAIDVTLRYFHTLAYDDGWYEFVFPMVVGPRFNPATLEGTGIGAVARSNPNPSGHRTEVRYLAPHERSGHDIGLRVNIDAGVAIEETSCASHRTTPTRQEAGRMSVALNQDDKIPNKDFVLRYRVAGDRIKSELLTHRDERGGYFTLMLYPPADLQTLTRQPLELVFVLDCSGSMSGAPIDQAKTAIRRALSRLQPGDSFQIINFSERSSALGAKPLEATPANVRRGLDYLASLTGDGPTMMIEGIKAALDFPHDPERLRFVSFLTDGYIGNDTEILAAVEKRLGASRLFSFGVGSSPNRYLLDGLARLGRGAVAYLGLRDDAGRVMDAFFDRISHPALTDAVVDWGGLNVTEVYPARVPDLFVGRPVVLTGRFDAANASARPIQVQGRAGGQSVAVTVPLTTPPPDGRAQAALPAVWARMKIAALSDRQLNGTEDELAASIRRVALDYNLMSAYTAFVAVDASRATSGAPGTAVPVAVPVPEGVNHQKTVQEQ